MNRQELYNEIKTLAPFISHDEDYRKVLRDVLSKYRNLLSQLDGNERLDNWDACTAIVKELTSKIMEIATTSYKGLPSIAYTKFKNVLNKYMDDIIFYTEKENTSFYRIRVIKDRRTGIKYDEMFHIPLTCRRIVKTQRYSTPGFPCLYLGMSVYGCWEEMHRPIMTDCWISRLENTQEIKLLDLRIPTYESFSDLFDNYIYMIPFILSCMIPVKNADDIYKPEYIIPQLFVEWVIKTKKCDGIIYTSCHKNNEFDFPEDKHENIAIPVKEPCSQTKFCPRLKSMFKITNPINNEIEQLRKPYQIDGGDLDIDRQIRNYSTSNFGILEQRLKDDYQLHDIQ